MKTNLFLTTLLLSSSLLNAEINKKEKRSVDNFSLDVHMANMDPEAKGESKLGRQITYMMAGGDDYELVAHFKLSGTEPVEGIIGITAFSLSGSGKNTIEKLEPSLSYDEKKQLFTSKENNIRIKHVFSVGDMMDKKDHKEGLNIRAIKFKVSITPVGSNTYIFEKTLEMQNEN